MSTDDLEPKTSQTGGLRRLKKPGETQPKPPAQNLVEQVPAWLKRLLAKYGEKEGRLIGLGEGGEAGEGLISPRGGYTGALTNLLEEMADEDTPEFPPNQLATSVEWGGQDEPVSPSFDDFLASLDPSQTDYQDVSPAAEAPDWITGISPESSQPESGYDRYALPPEGTSEDGAPDWLIEMMGPDVSIPPPAAPQVDEAPDWLTEALEPPSSPGQIPPAAVSSPPAASDADVDIPDWLNAALETPAARSEAPPQTSPAAPTQADFDVPDWLTGTPAEPALPETFAPPIPESSLLPADEVSPGADVPDWLSDIVLPPGREETDIAERESTPDVPDWLADIAPPATSRPELPAWDASDQITTDMDDQAPESMEKLPASAPETSSWFAQEEDLPSLDWLFEAESDTPAVAKTEDTVQEYPDWFNDTSGAMPALPLEESIGPETLSSPGSEAVPSWLEDAQFSAPVPEPEIGAIPDWLEDIQEETGTLEAGFDHLPTWLENLQTDSMDAPETDLTSDQAALDWPAEAEAPLTGEMPPQPVSSLKNLKSLRRLSPQPTPPAELETSPPLPDWAASLVPAETETGNMSPALPDWAADLIPPGAKAAGAAAPALPDWAEKLQPPDIEAKITPPPDQPPEQLVSRPLRRLTDVSKPATDPSPPIPTAETSGGLPALTGPMVEEDQVGGESFDWLSDLPSAEMDEVPDWMAETDQARVESSDWLSNLSAKAGETPDWMAESYQASQDVAEPSAMVDEGFSEETTADEENLLAARLGWFTQGRPEEDAASTPTQATIPPAEQEIPDWLTGTSGESSPEASTLLATPEAEEELESLDWLTDLPFSTADDEPPVLIGEAETPSDLEMPSWLADLPPLTPPSTPVELTEAEEDVPSWLTELPESAGVDWPTQTEPDQEPEASSWLTELSEVSPSTPTSLAPLERTEVEEETPIRVTDFVDAGHETPRELTDLPETSAAESESAQSILDAEDEIDQDLETPSWLTDLLEAHDPEVALSTEPADVNEAEADLEPPPWLAEWPRAETTSQAPVAEIDNDLEMPSWLAELGEAPEAETVSPLPAVETEEDVESEAPPWLTLSAPPADEARIAVSVEEPEADLEMPSWLAELSEAPTAETSPSGLVEETELETPSWMAGLPEATEATTAREGLVEEVGTEAEQEITSWLSELSEMAEPGEMADAREAEAELELPDWLSDLPDMPPAEAIIPETDATGLVEVEPETEQELPTWLQELPEASVREAEPIEVDETLTVEAGELDEEVENEEDLVIPSWLTGVAAVGAAEMVETDETAAEVDIPSWLTELPEVDEAEVALAETIEGADAEVEPELPSWMTELPEAVETEAVAEEAEAEAEPQLPSWVSELPEAVETEAVADEAEAETEQELPAWLQELPEASAREAEPIEVDETLTVEAGELAEEVEDEEDLVIPSWLTGVAAASVAVGAAEIVEPDETAAEVDIPFWLTELPEVDEAEVALAETVEATDAEVEPELPSWMTELPEAVETEAEPQIPSWVIELPEAVETETVADEAEPETEQELPAWLQELPEASAREAEPIEVDETTMEVGEQAEEIEADEELVIPSWLTGVAASSVAVGAAEIVEPDETAAEVDMPSWLTDLPEVDEAEAALAETVEATEAEVEPELPSWMTELPEAVETEAVAEEAESEEEKSKPDWLVTGMIGAAGAAAAATALTNIAEIETPQETLAPQSAEIEETPPPTGQVDEAPTEAALDDDLPPWLADLSTEDLKLPSWLSDAPELAAATPISAKVSEAELDTSAEQVVSPEDRQVDELAAESAVADDTDETELPSESDWLAGLGAATAAVKAAMSAEELEEASLIQTEEEPELPAWLTDMPQTVEAVSDAPATDAIPESEELGLADVEPEAPDWLKESSDIEAPSISGVGTATLQPPVEPKPSPTERMSDWLRNMQPSEVMLSDEDNQVAESTGVLTGLAPLLPAEIIAAPTPLLDPHATASTAQADAMLEAARHFYVIATQAPQPVALPEPLTQRDRLVGNVLRGVFYLIFMILIALPLIPGWQKVADPTTGQKVPWTEPAGELSGVLDKQRRELVSVQLGAIDLQQPGSVALVSFDYSTATQGEMQPLAEDIVGRLRGQGMRLIFISLEPEGAILAQRTLDQNLAERGETYGAEMVNLGYVPGQIAGIRELVTGRKQLAALADFKEDLTFAAPERAAWSSVANLGQVDIVITLTDNPVTARWWIEQMAVANPPDDGERYLLAVTSATADPFLRAYLDSGQLNGLISGINGAAAIEAGRKNFGLARQMLDSQGIAHLLIVVLIALGTMFGWMPPMEKKAKVEVEAEVETEPSA